MTEEATMPDEDPAKLGAFDDPDYTGELSGAAIPVTEQAPEPVPPKPKAKPKRRPRRKP